MATYLFSLEPCGLVTSTRWQNPLEVGSKHLSEASFRQVRQGELAQTVDVSIDAGAFGGKRAPRPAGHRL